MSVPTTHEQKRKNYAYKKWACPVPPVCTAFWYEDEWIKWIDKHGRWL